MMQNIRILLVFLLAMGAASAQSRIVALTFDDLPVAERDDGARAQSITSAILNSLDQHRPGRLNL